MSPTQGPASATWSPPWLPEWPGTGVASLSGTLLAYLQNVHLGSAASLADGKSWVLSKCH